MKKVLVLFAGSRSFEKVAHQYGISTYSSDWNKSLQGIDYCCDIMDFDVQKVLADFGVPCAIQASPDCAVWSKAAGDVHIKNGVYVSDKAWKAKDMVIRTMEIIAEFRKYNPNLVYWIENPVGKLYKQDFMSVQPSLFGYQPILPDMREIRFDQCQYGREFKKPTTFFTNDTIFKAKPRCNYNPTTKTGRYCSHKPNGVNGSSNSSSNVGYYVRAHIAEDVFHHLIQQHLIYQYGRE